jgi:purine-binding chemotaxis protein CheW
MKPAVPPTDAEILRARAQALAQIPASAPAADTMLAVLEFRLAQERYAVEVRQVREVQPFVELTPLPCTPAFVLGIVNVRGRMLPVFDLKKLLGLPDPGITDLHQIILVGNHELELGLLADVVDRISSIPVDRLQPAWATLAGAGAAYVKGVTDTALVVLDVERILTDPKIIVHEEVETSAPPI